MEQPVKCTVRAVPRHMVLRASTATAPLSARPQTVTSMRPRMGTPTRTRAAAGAAIRTIHRNPVHQAGDLRIRAADHRHSAAAAEGGDPGRRALVVPRAPATAAVGVVAADERNS